MLIYKICLEGELFFYDIPEPLLALIFYIFRNQKQLYEYQIPPEFCTAFFNE